MYAEEFEASKLSIVHIKSDELVALLISERIIAQSLKAKCSHCGKTIHIADGECLYCHTEFDLSDYIKIVAIDKSEIKLTPIDRGTVEVSGGDWKFTVAILSNKKSHINGMEE